MNAEQLNSLHVVLCVGFATSASNTAFAMLWSFAAVLFATVGFYNCRRKDGK